MTKQEILKKYRRKRKEVAKIFRKSDDLQMTHVCRQLRALGEQLDLFIYDLEELK